MIGGGQVTEHTKNLIACVAAAIALGFAIAVFILVVTPRKPSRSSEAVKATQACIFHHGVKSVSSDEGEISYVVCNDSTVISQ